MAAAKDNLQARQRTFGQNPGLAPSSTYKEIKLRKLD
jgi:hypothetical protein